MNKKTIVAENYNFLISNYRGSSSKRRQRGCCRISQIQGKFGTSGWVQLQSFASIGCPGCTFRFLGLLNFRSNYCWKNEFWQYWMARGNFGKKLWLSLLKTISSQRIKVKILCKGHKIWKRWIFFQIENLNFMTIPLDRRKTKH